MITEGKWMLEGYDTFEGGSDAYYPLGESDGYDSEAVAEEAARAELARIEQLQPSGDSGGQDFFSIQDRIYIISPDGQRRRFSR